MPFRWFLPQFFHLSAVSPPPQAKFTARSVEWGEVDCLPSTWLVQTLPPTQLTQLWPPASSGSSNITNLFWSMTHFPIISHNFPHGLPSNWAPPMADADSDTWSLPSEARPARLDAESARARSPADLSVRRLYSELDEELLRGRFGWFFSGQIATAMWEMRQMFLIVFVQNSLQNTYLYNCTCMYTHIVSYHIMSYHISYIIYQISYIIHHISYIISYHSTLCHII